MSPTDTIANEIAQERHRQFADEGYDPHHDDSINFDGELASAAAIYAYGDYMRQMMTGFAVWPWPGEPKFSDRRRDLIKAGALIIAEIERLDRKDGKPPYHPSILEQETVAVLKEIRDWDVSNFPNPKLPSAMGERLGRLTQAYEAGE